MQYGMNMLLWGTHITEDMFNLFEKMKHIDANFKILSIGMSDDYALGIKNGSNMIRVGSKIFGKRNY